MPLKKVLIVDDSTTMRKIIARVLRQADISIECVLEAANGIEGLERIASDPDIQLVLSDVNMPAMDGIAFVRAVRATHPKEQMPMIMITTEGGEVMMRAALDSGANGYVRKPFNSDTIRGALEEYLVEAESERRDVHAIASQDLLRGLRSSVDEVFATMLSSLGVQTLDGGACLLDASPADGAEAHDAITVEARVEIEGPLQGWISLSCTARAADDIARGMLLVGANDVLAQEEVEDALKECANMIAGLLKSEMLDARGSYSIGIPSITTRKLARARPHGTLAYRLCAGTFDAALWLDRRPEPT